MGYGPLNVSVRNEGVVMKRLLVSPSHKFRKKLNYPRLEGKGFFRQKSTQLDLKFPPPAEIAETEEGRRRTMSICVGNLA